MSITALVLNPATPRALVVGVFGGAGLALTAFYSRRGPMIYPVYAAILAALAMLLSRFPELSFAARFVASLAGFAVASVALYVATGFLAARQRRRLVETGRLDESALTYRTPLLGHAWRMGFLLAVGTIVSAGVAFIAV